MGANVIQAMVGRVNLSSESSQMRTSKIVYVGMRVRVNLSTWSLSNVKIYAIHCVSCGE